MTQEEILISKAQLSSWIKEKRAVIILDIRPLKEREEWFIPGSIHVNIYDKLKADDPTAFDEVEIPNDGVIVTVCGGGKLSITAAEKLKSKGYKALSLEGGIKAWRTVV